MQFSFYTSSKTKMFRCVSMCAYTVNVWLPNSDYFHDANRGKNWKLNMLLSRCYHPAFTDSFTEFCAGYSPTGVRCNASSRYIFWYLYEPPWNLYPQLSEPLLTMCFPMRLKSRAFLKQSIPWDVKNSIYLPAHSGKSLFSQKLLWPSLFLFGWNGQDTLLWQAWIF